MPMRVKKGRFGRCVQASCILRGIESNDTMLCMHACIMPRRVALAGLQRGFDGWPRPAPPQGVPQELPQQQDARLCGMKTITTTKVPCHALGCT